MVTAPSRSWDVNEALEVLSNERRRIVLEELLERRRPVPVAELVDSVVAAESNDRGRPNDLRTEVVLSLHHNHLPKLDRSKIIDHDTERGLIAVREAMYAVEPYLELSRNDGRRG
ncbi:DUF7344 domain-containing protein [Halosolutus gelatinilyticus]|uniref:DUF7344 domain-containing protein n=1 Tax=Halosolutus gelatinilyticus TaxID=2931975 RepID=UPI001FF1F85C|nr:hypothetical protein [Halosolutus gelatinilyticus]